MFRYGGNRPGMHGEPEGTLPAPRHDQGPALPDLLESAAAEYNKALDDLDEAMALATARQKAAIDWIATNSLPLIADYNRLLTAFLTRDEAAVIKALDDCGERRHIVLSIPVYKSDGTETISFAVLAAAVFPDNADIIAQTKSATRALPARVTEEAKAEPITPTPLRATVHVQRADNNANGPLEQRLQEQRLQELVAAQRTLAAEIVYKPNDMRFALERAMEKHLEEIAQMAARHFALLHAFERMDEKSVLHQLKILQENKMAAQIFARGTMDNKVPTFTALALRAFDTKPDAAAQIYNTLLQQGHEPHPEHVLQMTLRRDNPLPVSALRDTMAALKQRGGMKALQDFVLSPGYRVYPLLARAAARPDVTDALLERFKSTLTRGALLRESAARVDTYFREKDLAKTLLAQADAASGGDWLDINGTLHLRLAAVDCAEETANGMTLWTAGIAHTLPLDKEERAELRTRLAAQRHLMPVAQSFVAPDNICALSVAGSDASNRTATMVLQSADRPPFTLSRMGQHNLLTALARYPQMLVTKSGAVNIGKLDSVEKIAIDDGYHIFSCKAGEKKFHLSFTPEDAALFTDRLKPPAFHTGSRNSFIRLDNAIDVYYTADNTAEDTPQAGTVTLHASFPDGEETATTLPRAEAQQVLNGFLSRAFMAVAENQAIRPDGIKLLRTAAEEDGSAKITFTAGTAVNYASCADAGSLEKTVAAIVAMNSRLQQVAQNMWIDMTSVASIEHKAKPEKIVAFIGHESWNIPQADRKTVDAFREAALESGFVRISDQELLNPATIAAVGTGENVATIWSDTKPPQKLAEVYKVALIAAGRRHLARLEDTTIARLLEAAKTAPVAALR